MTISYWSGVDARKRYSGYRSISRRAVLQVRPAFSRVCEIGHSQAQSMCAWPAAIMVGS